MPDAGMYRGSHGQAAKGHCRVPESLKAMDPYRSAESRAVRKFIAAIEQYQDTSDRAVGLLTAGKTGDALDLLSSDATMKR